MSRVAAEKRLERLLVMVPWVMQRDGPEVTEVCERFAMTESELASDLEMLFLCGLYPFTPDTLIEADIVDGRVWIRSADQFQRPPRFTAEEALSLVAAASTVADLAGNEDNAVLRLALAKLSGALGLGADSAVDVALAPATPAVLDAIRSAAHSYQVVELDYYSYGRDAWSRRRIAPYRVFNSEGHWYVQATAPQDNSFRNFRVDRIRNATVLDEVFVPTDEVPEARSYNAREQDPVAVLELDAEAMWVLEQYPLEHVESCGDAKSRVTMRVSEKLWFERLLLRLGEHAKVVSGDIGVQAPAKQILRRYEMRAGELVEDKLSENR